MTAPREQKPCEYIVDHDHNRCEREPTTLFLWHGSDHYEWRCERHAPMHPTTVVSVEAPREPVDIEAIEKRWQGGFRPEGGSVLEWADVRRDIPALMAEVRRLREALANARAYILRGPSVDAADLLADIDALLGERV